jgi:hypothetical protein
VRMVIVLGVIIALIVVVAVVLGIVGHSGAPNPNGMGAITVGSLQR